MRVQRCALCQQQRAAPWGVLDCEIAAEMRQDRPRGRQRLSGGVQVAGK
jgi:hypothetical protein